MKSEFIVNVFYDSSKPSFQNIVDKIYKDHLKTNLENIIDKGEIID